MILSFGSTQIALDHPSGIVDAFLSKHFEGLAAQLFGKLPAPFWSLQRAARSGRKAAVNLPVGNYPPMPPVHMNQLYWPTGAARWGFGLFLIDDQAAGKITANARDTLTFNDSPFPGTATTPAGIVLGSGNLEGGITATMNVLRPIKLTALYNNGGDASGAAGAAASQWFSINQDSLYILPLVDDRFYWQFANMGNGSYLSCTTDWEGLFNQIENALNITINFPTAVEDEYLNPDVQEFLRRYGNAALLLDAALLSVGRRLVLDPSTNTYSALNSTDSDNVIHNQNTDPFLGNDPGFAAGSEEEMLSTGSSGGSSGNQYFDGQLPKSVVVTFPKSWLDVAQANGDVYAVSNATSDFVPNVSTKANSVKTIYSTCMADYSYAAGGSLPTTPNNASDLADLAQQIAQDYLLYASILQDGTSGGTRATFNGLRDWTLSGYDDHVRWLARRLPDGRYDSRTLIAPYPSNFGAEEQLSQDSFAPPNGMAPSSSGVVGPLILGQVNADIAKGSTGTINIFAANDPDLEMTGDTGTGETITALAQLFAVFKGDWVEVGEVFYSTGCGDTTQSKYVIVATEDRGSLFCTIGATYPATLPYSGSTTNINWSGGETLYKFTTTDDVNFVVPDNGKYLVTLTASFKADWTPDDTTQDVLLNVSLDGGAGNFAIETVGFVNDPSLVVGPPPSLTPNYVNQGYASAETQLLISGAAGATISAFVELMPTYKQIGVSTLTMTIEPVGP